jgi:uncharacterized membrane protein (UPF0127 family)
MGYILTLLALMAAALPAQTAAFTGSAIVFQKDTLSIHPRLSPEEQMTQEEPRATDGDETSEAPEKTEAAPPATRQPVELKVEIRGEQALESEWLWLGNLFRQEQGMLIFFDEAMMMPVQQRNVLTPVDILFIDQQGIITRILPDITLSELMQDIYPDTAVKAWLYLKGGSVKELGIRPGDTVDHRLFSPDPLILQ